MSGDDDAMWKPVAAADVTDDKLVAGQLRALQREVRDGFDAIARSLTAFERIEARLDVLIDRQNVTERRVDDIERRLTALESKPKRRKPARRK